MATYLLQQTLLDNASDPQGFSITVYRIDGEVISEWPHERGDLTITADGEITYDDGGDITGHPAPGETALLDSFEFTAWNGYEENKPATFTLILEGEAVQPPVVEVQPSITVGGTYGLEWTLSLGNWSNFDSLTGALYRVEDSGAETLLVDGVTEGQAFDPSADAENDTRNLVLRATAVNGNVETSADAVQSVVFPLPTIEQPVQMGAFVEGGTTFNVTPSVLDPNYPLEVAKLYQLQTGSGAFISGGSVPLEDFGPSRVDPSYLEEGDRTVTREQVIVFGGKRQVSSYSEAVTIGAGSSLAAPKRVGSLGDETFDLDSGDQVVETALVFEGEELTFSVSGAGASIDASTGVATIPTDIARSGAVVTVTASNAAGSESASFQVTVEEEVALPAGFNGPHSTSTTFDDTESGISLTTESPLDWAKDSVGQPVILLPASGVVRITGESLACQQGGSPSRWINGTMLNPWRGMVTHDASRNVATQGLDQQADYHGQSDFATAWNGNDCVSPGYTGHPLSIDIDNARYSVDGEETWLAMTSDPKTEGFTLMKCQSISDVSDFTGNDREFSDHLVPFKFVPNGTPIPAEFAPRGLRGDQSEIHDYASWRTYFESWPDMEFPSGLSKEIPTWYRSTGVIFAGEGKRGTRPRQGGLATYGEDTLVHFYEATHLHRRADATEQEKEDALKVMVPAIYEVVDTLRDGDSYDVRGGMHYMGYYWAAKIYADKTGEQWILDRLSDAADWSETGGPIKLTPDRLGMELENGVLQVEHTSPVPYPTYGLRSKPEDLVTSNVLARAHGFRQYTSAFIDRSARMLPLIGTLPGMYDDPEMEAFVHLMDMKIEGQKIIRANQSAYYIVGQDSSGDDVQSTSISPHWWDSNPNNQRPSENFIEFYDMHRADIPLPHFDTLGSQPEPDYPPRVPNTASWPSMPDTSDGVTQVQLDPFRNMNGGTLQRTDIIAIPAFESLSAWDLIKDPRAIIADVTEGADRIVSLPNGTVAGGQDYYWATVHHNEYGPAAVGTFERFPANPNATKAPVNWTPMTVLYPGLQGIGETATVTAYGDWEAAPAPSFSVRWQRRPADSTDSQDWATISGTEGNDSYTYTESDVGFDIRPVLTATNSEGSATLVGPEAPQAIEADPTPFIDRANFAKYGTSDGVLAAATHGIDMAGRHFVITMMKYGDVPNCTLTIGGTTVSPVAAFGSDSTCAVYLINIPAAETNFDLVFSETGGAQRTGIYETSGPAAFEDAVDMNGEYAGVTGTVNTVWGGGCVLACKKRFNFIDLTGGDLEADHDPQGYTSGDDDELFASLDTTRDGTSTASITSNDKEDRSGVLCSIKPAAA